MLLQDFPFLIDIPWPGPFKQMNTYYQISTLLESVFQSWESFGLIPVPSWVTYQWNVLCSKQSRWCCNRKFPKGRQINYGFMCDGYCWGSLAGRVISQWWRRECWEKRNACSCQGRPQVLGPRKRWAVRQVASWQNLHYPFRNYYFHPRKAAMHLATSATPSLSRSSCSSVCNTSNTFTLPAVLFFSSVKKCRKHAAHFFSLLERWCMIKDLQFAQRKN